MNELKPCPFCGLIRNIRIVTSHNDYTGSLTPWCAGVLCAHCGNAEVTLGGETKEDAIASTALIWNIRPIEDELRAALDAAKAENARLQKMVDWLAEANATTCELFLPTNFRSDPEIWKESARQAVEEVENEKS